MISTTFEGEHVFSMLQEVACLEIGIRPIKLRIHWNKFPKQNFGKVSGTCFAKLAEQRAWFVLIRKARVPIFLHAPQVSTCPIVKFAILAHLVGGKLALLYVPTMMQKCVCRHFRLNTLVSLRMFEYLIYMLKHHLLFIINTFLLSFKSDWNHENDLIYIGNIHEQKWRRILTRTNVN